MTNPASDLAKQKWAKLKGTDRSAATAAARKAASKKTKKQRAAAAKKGWETRRAKS